MVQPASGNLDVLAPLFGVQPANSVAGTIYIHVVVVARFPFYIHPVLVRYFFYKRRCLSVK
jgi:hypothetical protein